MAVGHVEIERVNAEAVKLRAALGNPLLLEAFVADPLKHFVVLIL